MKREARFLLVKAVDSLVLSIEHFNRPYERGRMCTTLILLHHSFEMLVKACIVHRNGRIMERGARETLGFKTCVAIATSRATIQFLSEDDALTLRSIYGLRNGAQHYVMYVSEHQLYVHCQSGLTLFRDVLRRVFQEDLVNHVPARVLPISVTPPTDVITLFDEQLTEVRRLLEPGRRRRAEALARLRPLAILDRAVAGDVEQPTEAELSRYATAITAGRRWSEVFPGASLIAFSEDDGGASIGLRITKKEGIPIHVMQSEGGVGVPVALKRVNELSFYNLGRNELAEKVGLSTHRTSAMIWHLKLQESEDHFKEIVIGKTRHKRYSQKCIAAIIDAAKEEDLEDICSRYQRRKIPA